MDVWYGLPGLCKAWAAVRGARKTGQKLSVALDVWGCCTVVGGRTVSFGIPGYDGFGQWLRCRIG
jgi:hypothetical protein